jgi:hypothetical protein
MICIFFIIITFALSLYVLAEWVKERFTLVLMSPMYEPFTVRIQLRYSHCLASSITFFRSYYKLTLSEAYPACTRPAILLFSVIVFVGLYGKAAIGNIDFDSFELF